MKLDIEATRESGWEPLVSAVKASENDSLRSNFLRGFLQSVDSSSSSGLKTTRCIPRVIVQFWDEIDIPGDVQGCIESWQCLKSKGFQYHLFDTNTARQFILDNLCEDNVKAFDRCYHPAMKSDYFRLCYIYCKGGFYVDVDDVYSGSNIDDLFCDYRLKLQPLCFDIAKNAMVSPDKIDFNKEFSDSRIFYFNNNPIVAPQNNRIIEYALKRSTCQILGCDESAFPEIQSTTGPGNLSASVVACLADCPVGERERYLHVLFEWESYAQTIWELSYRNDDRNWRLSNKKNYSRS